MATLLTKPGEVFDVRHAGAAPSYVQVATLVKTDTLEVKRLSLPEGRRIPTHHAPGEITVHCLEGRITFTSGGTPRELKAGQMLFLNAGELHSLDAIEDSSVLVTKVLPARS
jgi:quercetin dioxygenase-like cupin family protein